MVHLPLPPQHWDSRCPLLVPGLSLGLWGSSSPHLVLKGNHFSTKPPPLMPSKDTYYIFSSPNQQRRSVLGQEDNLKNPGINFKSFLGVEGEAWSTGGPMEVWRWLAETWAHLLW